MPPIRAIRYFALIIFNILLPVDEMGIGVKHLLVVIFLNEGDWVKLYTGRADWNHLEWIWQNMR